ncbi:hypothetical protein BHE74_00025080 [Ensete ventricosum]|nr:hypothetical protein BHE74_00025080 [Ensete ventricosum]
MASFSFTTPKNPIMHPETPVFLETSLKNSNNANKQSKMKMDPRTNLNGGEISPVEHIRGLRNENSCGWISGVSCHFGARMTLTEAGADLGPVAGVGDTVLEPTRVVRKLVLEEGAVHDDLAVPAVGDGEGEDNEAKECRDDEEHGEEVEAEQPHKAVAGSGEAHEGDDHDGNADDDERPLEEAEAVGGVGLGAQPYATAQDRDRYQKRYKVHSPYQAVGTSYHLSRLLLMALCFVDFSVPSLQKGWGGSVSIGMKRAPEMAGEL